MNYLSLFSGIGGLDLGLDRAGWSCVGQVELDPYCRRVLDKHWPEVPKHDDVRSAVDWWLGESRPAVDAVVGGFPCQPVSVAGKQKAQQDDRWLWPAMAWVIRQLRPQWAVLENVPGLLSRGMGDVLGDLAACGYDAQWDCIPAAAVGAPHRRDRVFMVAYPSSEPGWLQPEPESECGCPSVAGVDGPRGHVANADGTGRPPLLSERNESTQVRSAAATSSRGRAVADAEGDRRGTGWAWRPPVDGSAWPSKPAPRLDWAHPDTVSQGRLARGTQAGGEAAAGAQEQDRSIASGGAWWAAEPDVGRVAYGVPARVDRLRALGNAVVPQVAEHIGRLINASLEAA